MKKAPTIRRYHKPTGKWVTDADLRHDAAIKLGCPTLSGPPVNVNFLTSTLREKQKELSGYLVVDAQLITELFDGFTAHIARYEETPTEIQHLDYPSSRFLVRRYASRRTMRRGGLITDPRQANIPGPVEYIVFFRVPVIKPIFPIELS